VRVNGNIAARVFRVALAAIAAVVMVACGDDEIAGTTPITLSLSGSVAAADNSPLAGASVLLTLPSTEEGDTLRAVVGSAQTDASGHFTVRTELLALQCRTSSLVFQKAGFFKQTIEAGDGYECRDGAQTVFVRLNGVP
jgi:hypothetical protein